MINRITLQHKAPHSWGFMFVGGWVDFHMLKCKICNRIPDIIESPKCHNYIIKINWLWADELIFICGGSPFSSVKFGCADALDIIYGGDPSAMDLEQHFAYSKRNMNYKYGETAWSSTFKHKHLTKYVLKNNFIEDYNNDSQAIIKKVKKVKLEQERKRIDKISSENEAKRKRKNNILKSIKNLLKEKAIKMPASDIDAFLKHQNVDEIKELCEQMYHKGEISRTANYRYFILSEEKKVPKKASAPKSEAVDVKAELKKYKEMLDEGLITQEQYDAKSNELLGL